jgi:hypothetical protein
MLQLVHFEATAKRMGGCECSNRILCKNVEIAAQQFLHRHMFTIQLLPKHSDIIQARKHAGHAGSEKNTAVDTTTVALPPTVFEDEPIVANSVALQEKLDALLEQQDQLRGFLNASIQDGKAEEAAALQRAIGECKEEIRRVRSVLRQ